MSLLEYSHLPLKVMICVISHLLVYVLYRRCRALVKMDIVGRHKRYERVVEIGEIVSFDIESEL